MITANVIRVILAGLPVCGNAVLVYRKWGNDWFQAMVQEIKPFDTTQIMFVLSNHRILYYQLDKKSWKMEDTWTDIHDSDDAVYKTFNDVNIELV